MEEKVYIHPGSVSRYMIDIPFKRLDENTVIPSYANEEDAGLDFTATSKTYDDAGNIMYGTSIALAIPKGYVGLLFPRSSVSKKLQILANSVGVIDSSYRGEIIFKFKPIEGGHSRNISTLEDQYEVGDRIGQIVILPYPLVKLSEVDELPDSIRGNNGFGSTGK